MNTYFYVDAFNLYFGCCRGAPFKWLDLATLMAVVGDVINFLISGKGLIIIGAIIFVIVYVISGLVFKLIELIAKIFASAPVSVIIGLAAIAVGVIVIFNPVLLGLVAWP